MSFQFNFDLPSAGETDDGAEEQSSAAATLLEKTQEDPPAQTADNPDKPTFKLIDNVLERWKDRRDAELDYIVIDLDDSVSPLLQVFVGTESEQSNDVIQDNKGIDLLPGVYEGGLKVWECSLDLCRYLATHYEELLANEKETTVLELGCGHGLPACLLLRQGLIQDKNVSVMFTDYNDFVLSGVALANIVLNTSSVATSIMPATIDESVVANHVILGAGDWMDMSSQLSDGTLQDENPLVPRNGRFHLVLAAETTYTEESARETAILMARHLEPESGIGLVACKRYYFGVGGGSDAFRQAAESQSIRIPNNDEFSCEYRLQVDTLQVYDNGVGNIRELLQVKCIQVDR